VLYNITDMNKHSIENSIKKGDILLTDKVWYYVQSDPAVENSGYFYVPRPIAEISYDYENYTDEEIMEFYIRDTLNGLRKAVEKKLEKYADDIRKKWKMDREELLVGAVYKTGDGEYVQIVQKDSDGVMFHEMEATPTTKYTVRKDVQKKSRFALNIVERVK